MLVMWSGYRVVYLIMHDSIHRLIFCHVEGTGVDLDEGVSVSVRSCVEPTDVSQVSVTGRDADTHDHSAKTESIEKSEALVTVIMCCPRTVIFTMYI